MDSFVIAVSTVLAKVPNNKKTGSVVKMFKPGENVPVNLFTPERLASKLARGVVRPASSPEPVQKVQHAAVLATPKGTIEMGAEGEELESDGDISED